MNEGSQKFASFPLQAPNTLRDSVRWENQTVTASKQQRIMIFGWEGRSKREFSGVKVMTIFTRVWIRWCGAHLSKLTERSIH